MSFPCANLRLIILDRVAGFPTEMNVLKKKKNLVLAGPTRAVAVFELNHI